jgi:hypothetical protein
MNFKTKNFEILSSKKTASATLQNTTCLFAISAGKD